MDFLKGKVKMTFKQVFLINSDLKMDKGKIAVQVAHGEVRYMEKIMSEYLQHGHKKNEDHTLLMENHIKWRTEEDNSMKKIVLKSPYNHLLVLMGKLKSDGIFYYPIHDRGLTQIEPNSLTCVVVEPLLEEKCDELFGYLKLL